MECKEKKERYLFVYGAVKLLSFDVGPGPVSIGIEVGKANPSVKSAGSRSKASVKDVFLVLSPKSASALPGVEVTVGGL